MLRSITNAETAKIANNSINSVIMLPFLYFNSTIFFSFLSFFISVECYPSSTFLWLPGQHTGLIMSLCSSFLPLFLINVTLNNLFRYPKQSFFFWRCKGMNNYQSDNRSRGVLCQKRPCFWLTSKLCVRAQILFYIVCQLNKLLNIKLFWSSCHQLRMHGEEGGFWRQQLSQWDA